MRVVFVASFECLQDVDGRGAVPGVRHSWVVNSDTSCQVRGLAPGVSYRLGYTRKMSAAVGIYMMVFTVVLECQSN